MLFLLLSLLLHEMIPKACDASCACESPAATTAGGPNVPLVFCCLTPDTVVGFQYRGDESLVMENLMERKMEHEVATGFR